MSEAESDTGTPEIHSDALMQSVAPPLKQGEWPGHINFADVRGNYTGCKAVLLDAEELNAYFAEYQHRLVVSITPAGTRVVSRPGPVKSLEAGAITMEQLDEVPLFLVLFTKTVTDKEIGYLERFGAKVRAEIEAEEAEQVEMDRKNQQAQAKNEEEAKRLTKVGKTCEEHHARLVEENRDLKKKAKKGKS